MTSADAADAAQHVVAALRRCEGAPPVLTAELDVVRGHGTVTALNARAPTTDDPRYPWHACVRHELERVRFPVSDTVEHVRVRLALE